MNSVAAPHTSTHSTQYYRNKERVIFASIPGMAELRQAKSEDHLHQLRLMYPDAAFALMIASNLFCPDRELTAIYLQAYRSILDGESIESVRFRFTKDIDAYWEKHMWDD